jgi:uncharacterized membrane protein YesL
MIVQSNFYKYLSLIKLVVGLIILFVDYAAINVFEDPFVAIWILLVGSFLVARWASFFFFMFTQKIFKNKKIQNSPESESYKLSFLFGMYAMLNIILILLWHWNKTRGLILLWGFILLLYFLMMDSSKNVKKSE